MPVSEKTYEQVAIEDPTGRWELVCGRLRSKPGVTFAHGSAIRVLTRLLILQLDEQLYEVDTNHARLRVSGGTYYVPDICVVPRALVQRGLEDRPGRLEVYEEPMPLVVEVWSPSTGDYDVEEKLREYQRRSDFEIWRIHPYDRTLTAWVRQPDGSYVETMVRSGMVRPTRLTGVEIDLASLFS